MKSEVEINSGLEQQSLRDFSEKAYLNYSMYVILDRALPHISDGLKPVQRRIIYAMSELGLKAAAKFKKSARTIGDVIGKYHPHGDTACYEAMVLMAQAFSYRYPLVDGQGNWGSSDDPKSFAAMRYTEARMTTYAELLLSEVEQGTVDWVPNFDGTLKEPRLLPSRVPNILLNGTTGIAVGMSTDIPSHNLQEVLAACIHVLENSESTLEEICKYINGPDFSTKAEIITPKSEILEMYKRGYGVIRMRATYTVENNEIIITALPHQISGSKILEQIASQMQAKKLPMVIDLRDESDHENPTRIVIVLRSNRIDVTELMLHLFATSDLEHTYRVNFNMIGIDGRPQVKNLLNILMEWLQYRMTTIKRRLRYRLDKVLERFHILEGLMVVYLNLDEVISIIRNEDHPKTILMQRFSMSDIQADAILNIKLRHIAKLEEIKIQTEKDNLGKERERLENTLNSPKRLKTLMKKELIADAKKYGDDRRSPIVERSEAKAISQETILPIEPLTIILSKKGWVRAAKGHEIDPTTLNYKSGDSFQMKTKGYSNQMIACIDSIGRSYSLPAYKLPSARSQGEPLTGYFSLTLGATFIAVLAGDPEQYFLVASDAGYGFITKLKNLYTKNRAGKNILTVPKGSRTLMPCRIDNIENQYIAAVTNDGRLLIFPVAVLPILPRGKGNKIINIPALRVATREEYVIDIAILNEKSNLILYAGKRHLTLKFSSLAYYQGERGRRGNKLPRGFRRVDYMVSD